VKEHGGKEPVWAKFISAPALYTQKAVDRMTSIFQVTLPPPPSIYPLTPGITSGGICMMLGKDRAYAPLWWPFIGCLLPSNLQER